MLAYSYDENGKYTGFSGCPLDPMKTKRLGTPQYLIPDNSTLIEPPEFDPETEFAIWDDGEWRIEKIPVEEPIEIPEPDNSEYVSTVQSLLNKI